MAMRLSTVCLAVALLCCFAAVSGATPDFSKMKIKELKAFLDQRGLSCEGCEEKAEFVKMCQDNANVPATNAKASGSKVSVPQGTLWGVWSTIAQDTCKEVAAKKSISEEQSIKTCGNIGTAVEAVFMQYGKRTAQKLRKQPAALLKTSHGETYLNAGKKMLAKVAGFCFHAKNVAKCASPSNIETLLEEDQKIKGVTFITYLTNVGIENTNPMYDVLKDKSLNNDEL